MSAKNLESICSQIKDILEENDIKEVPSFFVIRVCECDTNIVEDFMWYIKMLNLFEAQFELQKYHACEQTIKELQAKLGYHKVFYDMENRITTKAHAATTTSVLFLYCYFFISLLLLLCCKDMDYSSLNAN